MRKALYVSVILDKNLTKPLDYSVPLEMQSQIQPGTRIEVPFQKGTQKATVSTVKESTEIPHLRPILRILSDTPQLSEPLWKLARWMSHYYATPLQKVLRCFIPPNVRKEVQLKTQLFVFLGKSRSDVTAQCKELRRTCPAQAQVLDALLPRKYGLFLADLLRMPSISRSAVNSLVKQKLLLAERRPLDEDFLLEEEFFPTLPKPLNSAQQSAYDAISSSLKTGTFSTHLLFGITGSGKTEVYLQAIQAALDQNKSAILLVPEISLTSQTIELFRARFSHKIAIFHHRRSLGERSAAWERFQKGEIRIAIGARSAIFSPAQNLGLILVDEEHDSSYKSDEAPCYHARDLAVMRGSLENAVVVLGSATPSVESRYNAEIGKYRWHVLPSRATSASLPRVRIVDMKQAFDRAGGFTHFCPELLDGIQERLKKGEQTLLFFNRRGYHRTQMCAACRTVLQCPHCDLSLTFHRGEELLRCHLCDFSRSSPRSCPSCQSSESLQFKGFGTEHVERSLHALFPEVRTLRMDRDTTRNKNSHEELFRKFRSHKADILIGTQMIAKGFHFPAVTLVGVLNADAALSIPDFRAPEQVFQLLTQVAGRSGRSELPGEVIFQTFMPDHPVIRFAASQDYPAFYAETLQERRLFGYPPFCHLIKFTFASKHATAASLAAEAAHSILARHLPPTAQLLPPLPAGHPKIKDLYRVQFLVKIPQVKLISPLLSKLPRLPPAIALKIDVDPLTTFF